MSEAKNAAIANADQKPLSEKELDGVSGGLNPQPLPPSPPPELGKTHF